MVLNREEGKGNREKGGGAGVLAVLLLLAVSACSDPEPPQEFREAFTALDKALVKERLEASAFAPRFPNPTAQQVVSYLLSQAGAEVLQISGSPLSEDVDFLSDVPVWPSSITLWHTKRMTYGQRMQVILTWNDANDAVIAQALVAGTEEPVYTREWKVEPLAPKNQLDPSDTREFQAF